MLKNLAMQYCGYELMDIISNAFGGCLRNKHMIHKQKYVKYEAKFIGIVNYRPENLSDVLLNIFVTEYDGYNILLSYLAGLSKSNSETQYRKSKMELGLKILDVLCLILKRL
jgi:hypothetical protein